MQICILKKRELFKSKALNMSIPTQAIINQAHACFGIYSQYSGAKKASFLKAIATEIEALGDALIQTTMAETNLPEARLLGERGRTCMQLRLFAEVLEEGSWVEARIDTALPDRQPLPRPDLRKMQEAIGVVGVFAASNFPFAFSTAGGDTAAALAAGCPVVMKAHSGHLKTSEMVASAIEKARITEGIPEGVFSLLVGPGAVVGKEMVQHPAVKAIGFTGSYAGGMALYHLANERPEPIPVFSEMGSINPVILMPEKLDAEAESLAKLYAGSITVGVGQFCTNPGLILGVKGLKLDTFIKELGTQIEQIAPAGMLSEGIYKSYVSNRETALAQKEVKIVGVSSIEPNGTIQGVPTVASVNGEVFLQNTKLHQEVFGPYSLVVKCDDLAQIEHIINHLEGQLTATFLATENDLTQQKQLVQAVRQKCGRLLFNGVPTGVEVSYAMQHGGPFPSASDSRFTSVGPDAIKRFVRPASYQNFPDSLLPDALKQNNPLGIWRTVNGQISKN